MCRNDTFHARRGVLVDLELGATAYQECDTARVAELGVRLIVGEVEDSIRRGTVRLRHPDDRRNAAQSITLLEAIAMHGLDACIGGARRDEEKARAKERFFSFRDGFGLRIGRESGG